MHILFTEVLHYQREFSNGLFFLLLVMLMIDVDD
jgi:hypothetical protein